MPQVPSHGGPQVGQRPINAPRLPTGSSLEAFGGGQSAAEVTHASQGLARDAAGIAFEKAKEAKQQGDQLAILDALNKAHTLRTQIRTDALAQQGKNAFGAAGPAMEGWHKGTAEIASGLATDEQRQAFARHTAELGWGLNDAISSHVSGEIKRFDDETTHAYLENQRNDALQNFASPFDVMMAVDSQRAAVKDWAKRNGVPEDLAKAKVDETVSKTYTSIVERMVNLGADMDAKAFATEHKGEFGKYASDVDRMVEMGSTRGESLRIKDQVFEEREESANLAPSDTGVTAQKSPETLDEARERGKKLTEGKDAKLRDAVDERIIKEWHLRRDSEKMADEKLTEEAIGIIYKGGKMEDIPASTMLRLKPTTVKQLEMLAKGPPRESDPITYARFEALSDVALRSMSEKDFILNYQSKLSDTDFKAAARHRGDVLKGKSGDWQDPFTDKDNILNALRETGIGGIKTQDTLAEVEKDDKKAKAYLDLSKAFQAKTLAWTKSDGKPPNDERKKILMGELLTPIRVNGRAVGPTAPMWNTPTGRGFIQPYELMGVPNPSKEMVYNTKRFFELKPGDSLPIEDIPPTQLAAIKSKFDARQAASGVKYTPEKAARIYAALRAGNDAYVESVFQGKD